jgi:hypothetical protein
LICVLDSLTGMLVLTSFSSVVNKVGQTSDGILFTVLSEDREYQLVGTCRPVWFASVSFR